MASDYFLALPSPLFFASVFVHACPPPLRINTNGSGKEGRVGFSRSKQKRREFNGLCLKSRKRSKAGPYCTKCMSVPTPPTVIQSCETLVSFPFLPFREDAGKELKLLLQHRFLNTVVFCLSYLNHFRFDRRQKRNACLHYDLRVSFCALL